VSAYLSTLHERICAVARATFEEAQRAASSTFISLSTPFPDLARSRGREDARHPLRRAMGRPRRQERRQLPLATSARRVLERLVYSGATRGDQPHGHLNQILERELRRTSRSRDRSDTWSRRRPLPGRRPEVPCAFSRVSKHLRGLLHPTAGAAYGPARSPDRVVPTPRVPSSRGVGTLDSPEKGRRATLLGDIRTLVSRTPSPCLGR
jgi:hypothetical protein